MRSSHAVRWRVDVKEERVRSRISLTRVALVSLALLIAVLPGIASAQAVIKVNDDVNLKIGLLLQGQADWQQVANGANDGTGGWQQNMMIRRARIILGGQVAKDVFFYVDTENANLGKSTQTLTSGTTGVKAPGTGFNLLDAVGEWRVAKEFNIQFGEILVPINRWILTSSASTFMLDQSAYNIVPATALQNNTGRDTGFMLRGWFFCDRLEYRSAVLSGFRQPGVKNAPRFTERLQWNFFDTEVYNLPSYAGANWGNRKILALGGAYDTQGDYKLASADLFLDFPIDLGSFESTIAYQYINGGKFIASLPEENTFSVEAGVFLKGAKVAPIVRYEQKTFTPSASVTRNESRYVAGLNFYPFPKFENNFNIKVWFQRVTPNVGFATNEFTVQMQAFYF
jgi:hypothetical protein